jgi:hypothetical protein
MSSSRKIGDNNLIISKNFKSVLLSRSKENLIGQPKISHTLNSKLQDILNINPGEILCGVYS